MEYPYICRDCAKKNGAVGVEGHAFTVHMAICKYCNETKALAHLSDRNWPEQRHLERNREM